MPLDTPETPRARTAETLGRLSAEVRRLRDLEEIRRIRCRYHQILNDGRAGEHFDDCTEDVICQWDKEIPPQVGREHNQETSRKVMSTGIAPTFRQTIHNHLIELDGDTATATSQMEATPVQFGRSVTVASRWTDRYRREDGRWWIAEQRLQFYFQVFLDEGWAKDDRVFNPFAKVDISSNENRDGQPE
jgi:ketosteroid isomerase-like protein